MPVTKRGDRWMYRFRFGGKSYSGTLLSKTDAQRAEREKLQEVQRLSEQKSVVALVEQRRYELIGGSPIYLVDAGRLAFEKPTKRKANDQWMAFKMKSWNDFSAYMAGVYPGVDELSKVQRIHCEAYVSYLVDKGRYVKERESRPRRQGRRPVRFVPSSYDLLSGKTINEAIRVCKYVFRVLREDAALVSNPWDNVVTPAVKSEDRDIFSEAELDAIRRAINVPDWFPNAGYSPSDAEFCRPLFVVAAATGLTEGDICTLRWDEVHFDLNLICRVRNKTKVYMEIPMLAGLSEYIDRQPRLNDYVFPYHASIAPGSVSKRVIRFLTDLGIETSIKPGERRRAISVKDLHSMRHVFCYYAGAAGIPLNVVQSIVGHMTPDMTRHYMAHITRKAQQDAAERIPVFLDMSRQLPKSGDERAVREQLIAAARTAPIELVTQALRIIAPASPLLCAPSESRAGLLSEHI